MLDDECLADEPHLFWPAPEESGARSRRRQIQIDCQNKMARHLAPPVAINYWRSPVKFANTHTHIWIHHLAWRLPRAGRRTSWQIFATGVRLKQRRASNNLHPPAVRLTPLELAICGHLRPSDSIAKVRARGCGGAVEVSGRPDGRPRGPERRLKVRRQARAWQHVAVLRPGRAARISKWRDFRCS